MLPVVGWNETNFVLFQFYFTMRRGLMHGAYYLYVYVIYTRHTLRVKVSRELTIALSL